MHAPAVQISPDAHDLPHAPQFLPSRVTSTQIAPHLVVPVGHPLGTSAAGASGAESTTMPPPSFASFVPRS
jgi:hypothetical protein